MALPDDPDFENFVADILNATFSSTFDDMETDSDRENA